MKLIVGLGNPGSEYAGNRHNVGFMVVDELFRRWGGEPASKFKGAFALSPFASPSSSDTQGQRHGLLKPLTFMNRSGDSVGPCVERFGLEPTDVIVIHDELDVAFGELRIKAGGGHAGHNGLKSIMAWLGRDFLRVRVGIGRPPGPIVDHVLSDFDSDELPELDAVIAASADAVETILRHGPHDAMNRCNRKRKRGPSPTNQTGVSGPDATAE